ncbi:hypothetical protein D3C74_98180 [compost metagenome]
MDVIALFIIAGILFLVINKIFHITYYGFKGIFTLLLACLLVAAPIVNWAFIFIKNYYGWIIGAVIIIFILVSIGKSKSHSTTSESSEEAK